MVDYAKALREGFEAASRAEVARREIDGVFTEMNKQVLAATENKVSIVRMECERAVRTWQATIVSSILFPIPKEKYWAIVGFNPSVGSSSEVLLATWTMGKAGYPCVVTWDDTEHECLDREALATCLQELLSDPVIGQRLLALTKLEPRQKEGMTDQQENSA